MQRLVGPISLSLVLGIATSVQAASAVTPFYQAIHAHVYSEMHLPQPLTELNEEEQYAFVRTYCNRNPTSPPCANIATLTGGPVVLAFNHDSRAWRVVYGIDPRDVEFDKDRMPKVLGKSGTVVLAVVESTNPLYYTAEAGAVVETPEEVIADIQKLLDKLGVLAPAVIGLNGNLPGPILLQIATLETAIPNAKQDITCVLDHRKTARRFGDRVETLRAGTYTLLNNQCPGVPPPPPPLPNPVPLKSETLDITLDDIERAANAVGAFDFCSATATALRELAEMVPTNVPALRTKFNSITLAPTCDVNLTNLANTINQRITALEANPTSATLQQSWITFVGNQAKSLRERAAKVTHATALVADANTIVATEARTKVLGAVRDIERFEDRLLASVVTIQVKTSTSSIAASEVADFFVVPRGPITVVWDNVRSRSLDVKKTLPFTDANARRPDSITSKYEASSLFTSLIDFNVSLTYTPLASPVFGTVSEPAPTAADPNAKKNVIAKKDDDERAGKLGIFVALPVFYRANSTTLRRIGLEVGAGVDTEKTPALFLGASFKMNRAIRLGVGRTWQTVDALDGQKIGDVVATADDIKKKNKLAGDWYASFSFSLGSLKLFKDE